MDLEEPKIIFCGLDHALCRAWEEAIVSTPLPIAWDVRHQDIVTLECTAAVSPANSFGFMDGGVDLAYSRHFGWHVQERLQKAIQDMKFSELLVGQALAVETDCRQIPWLIAAPTMRVPGQILDSTAVFLAARAAMRCAIEHEMDTVAFPGMGTGTGGVRYEVAAKMIILGCLAAIKPQTFPRSLRELLEIGGKNTLFMSLTPSDYTAKMVDICALPVKNNLHCPHCANKKICRKPIPQPLQLLAQQIQQ